MGSAQRWIQAFCCLWFFSCLFLAPVLHAETAKGPLQVRNAFPLFFMFMTPIPDSPCLLNKNDFQFSMAVDYNSVFVNEASDDWEVLMDMETTLMDLRFEYGVTDFLTLSLQAPFVSLNSGFLDGFLENYHDTFGFPNYGREKRPKNEFGYGLYYKNKIWLQGRAGGFNLCDSTLSAKLKLIKARPDRNVDACLAYRLKLPLGDPFHGYGSGQFDHGLFLLTQTAIGDYPLILHVHPGFMLLSDPHTRGAEIHVDPSWTIFGGLEYLYSEKLSLLAQMNYFTSPFTAPGITQLDVGGLQLDFGFSYHFNSKSTMEFAFCEDLSGSGAPDFNVHLRTSYRF